MAHARNQRVGMKRPAAAPFDGICPTRRKAAQSFNENALVESLPTNKSLCRCARPLAIERQSNGKFPLKARQVVPPTCTDPIRVDTRTLTPVLC